jgi:hypothetical protein
MKETPSRTELVKTNKVKKSPSRSPLAPLGRDIKEHKFVYLLDILLFAGVVAVILIPSTHFYFVVTHWRNVITVVDRMQMINDESGKRGLDAEIKSIVNSK